jgi:hypothetical protein
MAKETFHKITECLVECSVQQGEQRNRSTNVLRPTCAYSTHPMNGTLSGIRYAWLIGSRVLYVPLLWLANDLQDFDSMNG